jgi:hypothetical protein
MSTLTFMRKYLDIKNLDAKIGGGVDDARAAAQAIGHAAESQATLNIALTGVCVCALLIAILAVRSGAGAGQ